MAAESSAAKANTLTMSGLVPGLRPPPTRPGAKGILLRRAVNISSQQEKLLKKETSWLGSDGKPDAKHKLVPDKVLKQLQQQAARDNQRPPAPSQREATPPGPAFDDHVPEKTATPKTATPKAATHKAPTPKDTAPKAATPRRSQTEPQAGIETRTLSQAAISSPPRPVERDSPQPAKKAVDARAQADGGKEGEKERPVPVPKAVEQFASTPAPVTVAPPKSPSPAAPAPAQVPAEPAAAQPAAAEPIPAEPVAADSVAAEPLPSIESDNVAEVVQPAQTKEPAAEREPELRVEAEAEAGAKQPEVEQARQPEAEAAPEPEIVRERSLAQENRSSPPVLSLRREQSEEWPDDLSSDDVDGVDDVDNADDVDNDDNDDYAKEMDIDSDSDSNNDNDACGEVDFDTHERIDKAQAEKDKDRRPELLPPTPKEQQQTAAPPVPSQPLESLESVASKQINSPYHGRSPDLGTSSPGPIEVDLPDMLDGGSQSRSHPLRRGIYSDSVGEQPSSSPTPQLPRSSLRRAVPQEPEEPQEVKSDGENNDLVSEVPETVSTNANASTSTKQQPQPQRRRMKPAIFPPKAPAQTRPPPAAPGATIGRDPSRQPSLSHPPIENIKRSGIATSDMATSPTVVTPNFQRTETYSSAVAEHRTVSVVGKPALAAHAPTSTPIPVAVAVAASSPPVRAPTYNNTPVSQQHLPVPRMTESPNPNLSRTWMMPFELFTLTYPDYRGDLEDFLRACYSLLHSSPGALPSFVFDDIVHAFLDYIEYVQTNASGSPQTLTQWYNLHATNLVCNQNVVTRLNVASILNAYPEEVKAIQTMTPRADSVQATVSIAAHSQGQGKAHQFESAKATPVSSEAEQPGSHESLPPGRPFPYEMGHHHHHPSPAGSSGPSNSIRHNLDVYANSNSTDSGGDLLRARLAQSQSTGLSQSQDNIQEPLGGGHPLGPTQSSWESQPDNRQLPLPSSPVPSAAVPAGMDKRAYLLRSLEPVGFTQPSIPFTQGHGSFSQEYSIEETPARPVSSTRKRVHQQFQERTPQQQRSASKNQKTPASTTSKNRTTPAGTVSAKKPRSVSGATLNGRSPQQPSVIEERDQDVPTAFDMAWDDDEDDDGEMDFETSFISVQSAAEARRPPPKPTAAVTAPRGSGGVSKERRRATIAASDIGMVARMAAAEEREAAATKRTLPASMKRASMDGQPPKKKKKVAKRLSFANFLEREIGPKPR